SRRRHTRSKRDWSSDVCSSDLRQGQRQPGDAVEVRGEEARVLESPEQDQVTGDAEPQDRLSPAREQGAPDKVVEQDRPSQKRDVDGVPPSVEEKRGDGEKADGSQAEIRASEQEIE